MSSTAPQNNTDLNENTSKDDIEDLLKQLHGQIKTSNWLATNTVNKLEEENPELIKAWKDAIDSENSK